MKTYITKSILVIMVLRFCCSIVAQNQITVTGVITAFESYPVNHAKVRSLKTGSFAESDSIGRFSINCIDNDILQFTAAGFADRKLRVKNVKQVYINLSYGYRDDSFDEAVSNNHITTSALEHALSKYPNKGMKDYSKYQNIYELVRYEFNTLRVNGDNIYNTKAISFSLSAQVLYVVNDMVVSDISFVSPVEVKKIEFIEDSEATAYGMRGANGVLKITLRNK